MVVTLSESARLRIRGYLDADPAALGLRFGVSRTGCSGWGYKVDMARAAADDLAVGLGHGPVHHFHALWPTA